MFFFIFFTFKGIAFFSFPPFLKGSNLAVFFTILFLPFIRIGFFSVRIFGFFFCHLGETDFCCCCCCCCFSFFFFCGFSFSFYALFCLCYLPFIIFLTKTTSSILLQDYRDLNVNIKITRTQIQ